MFALVLLAAGAGLTHEPVVIPQNPVSLRTLIQAADLIGIVVPVTSTPAAADLFGSSQTVLDVEKLLKGDIEDERLPVHTMPSLACPVDATFTAGRRTLVFLRLKAGTWRTCFYAWGAKELSDEGFTAYEARIREYLALGLVAEREERDQAELDWIVRQAVDPLTRWEGAFELNVEASGFAARLSAEQRASLLEALLMVPRRDAGSRELFHFFRAVRDPRLTRWMLNCLEAEAAALAWDYDLVILWLNDCLGDAELNRWVHANWGSGGTEAKPSLYFLSRTSDFKKVKEEEVAAVREFVERGRKILEQQAAR